jgi:hypothetical protein
MDRNVMPLVLTVTEAVEDDGAFETRMPSPLHAMVMQVAVHAWMEGHLAAPGHIVRDEPTDETMPAPPFPARDDPPPRRDHRLGQGLLRGGRASRRDGGSCCRLARGPAGRARLHGLRTPP